MDKREYLEAIQSAMDNAPPNIVPKLLISIDRGRGLEEAWENLSLAEDSRHCVGIDFSGDPRKASFAEYSEVFSAARDQGLKTTIHTAETSDFKDTSSILDFKPDRLGHCCDLDEVNFERIRDLSIPVELCPSSNLATMKWTAYDQHHFSKFYASGLPISICTDDTLLFQTDITKEHFFIAQAFHLSTADLASLVYKSRTQVFWEEGVEERLRSLVN
mmetsp:Transcript_849/g.1985  ORF Transcript_849/g.1985 Transcript_849/m.1985 type:complete len:217 (+) Transcript_849:5659-6309(+)